MITWFGIPKELVKVEPEDGKIDWRGWLYAFLILATIVGAMLAVDWIVPRAEAQIGGPRVVGIMADGHTVELVGWCVEGSPGACPDNPAPPPQGGDIPTQRIQVQIGLVDPETGVYEPCDTRWARTVRWGNAGETWLAVEYEAAPRNCAQ